VDFINALPEAFAAMASWTFLAAFLIGCVNGMITGLLPGLGGAVGIALMIPFTYNLDTATAMGLFVAALAGQTFCGSVTAILLNVPGSSPNAATTLDGYPLTRQGRGGFAIGISASASLLGAMIGTLVLIALIPAVRPLVLAFSFPEFTMLGILGLTIIAMASRGSMLKGIVSGMLGVLISFVGFAPIGGDVRYVFDQPSLYNGFDVVIVLVGMFALTEALELLRTNQSISQGLSEVKFGHKQIFEGVLYTLKHPWLVIRSSLLGAGIGLVPTVGGTVAAFLAYFQAARTVKNPRFGSGDPRGVIAPEASAIAKDSGSALPSLAFGIPGSADWAVVLGAMVIHGLTPGPNLIRESPDIVAIAIIVLAAACIFTTSIGLIFGPQLVQITRIKPGILSPTVLMLAVIGAYALNLSTTDVIVSICFGLVGYAMRSIGMPLIPFILGFILGPLVEKSYLQTISSYGGIHGFFTRPIAVALMVLTVAVLAYEIISNRKAAKRDPAEVARGVVSATRPWTLTLMGAFFVLALAALIVASGFSPEGRTFPMLTAGILIVLIGVYLAVALVPGLQRKAGGLISDGGGMETYVSKMENEAAEMADAQRESPSRESAHGTAGAVADDGFVSESRQVATAEHVASEPVAVEPTTTAEQSRESARRLRVSLLLVIGLLAISILFGLEFAVPVIFVLFMRLVTRESWRTTVLTTVFVCGGLYIVFHTLLGVPFEGGLLVSY
jgi:TctA family transporter